MGYFSNGTEGMIYESKYCDNCANQEHCHILVLHHLHNYTKNYVKRMMLNEFIPIDDKGNNQKCKMFLHSEYEADDDQHECNLCKKAFSTYNELMFHYAGDCEE